MEMGQHSETTQDTPTAYENKAYSRSNDDVTLPTASRDGMVACTEDTGDIRCGIGSCEPECLQVFNNAKAFLCWIFVLYFTQGFFVNALNNLNTPILERRFELTSSKAGLISSSYDISATLFSLPISYYGAHAHQPRMLSLASLLMASGSFIMVVPHFATGLYNLKETRADECVIGFNSTQFCVESESQSKLSSWLGVFILSMILNGISGTTMSSIAIAFLERSVNPQTFPIYQGVLFSGVTLGPAVSYLAGGYIIQNYYVDVDKVDPSSLHIDSQDPRHIGAWWIGIMASGVILVLVTLPLMCYPRELRGTKELRLKRQNEVHESAGMKVASEEGFGMKWRDMPLALKFLISNPIFTCMSLANACESLLMSGLATFMPKYLQNQFALTLGHVSIALGLVTVPGTVLGQISGGLICKLAKLKVKGMLRLCQVLSLSALMLSFIFLLRSTPPHFAGVNRQYENTTELLGDVNLHSDCNSHCGCTTLSYEPICSIDNVQYFSPCHAGCQRTDINGSKALVNCTCIEEKVQNDVQATYGVCEVDRRNFVIFMALLFVYTFVSLLSSVPTITVTLRCIPVNQRTFGIGVQWVIIRLLGSIPGPILLGYIFDKACRIWQKNCAIVGGCWIYDSHALGAGVLIVTIALRTISFVLFAMATKLYKPPPGGEDQREKHSEKDHENVVCQVEQTNMKNSNENIIASIYM